MKNKLFYGVLGIFLLAVVLVNLESPPPTPASSANSPAQDEPIQAEPVYRKPGQPDPVLLAKLQAAQAKARLKVRGKQGQAAARKSAQPKPTPVELKENRLAAARGACLIVLKRSLHDPASAKFGRTSRWYTKERKDGTILVQPQARAKNAFGAYQKGVWNCIVRPEGENIRVLSLQQIKP